MATDPDDPAPSAAMPEARPGPRDQSSAGVRLSPTRTLVIKAGDVAIRIKRRAWSRLAGWIRGLILAAAGAAGVYAIRHLTGW